MKFGKDTDESHNVIKSEQANMITKHENFLR